MENKNEEKTALKVWLELFDEFAVWLTSPKSKTDKVIKLVLFFLAYGTYAYLVITREPSFGFFWILFALILGFVLILRGVKKACSEDNYDD